jgi:hypothetical protein
MKNFSDRAAPGDMLGITKEVSAGMQQYPEMVMTIEIIRSWATILVTIVGLFGNIISFLITTKRAYRHISTCTYMSALAVLDTVFLIEYVLYVPFLIGVRFPHWQIVLV